MGSTTSNNEIFHDILRRGRNVKFVEINNIEGIKISSDKFKTKIKFAEVNVPTPEFFIINTIRPDHNYLSIVNYDRDNNNDLMTSNINDVNIDNIIYPIIAKKRGGSRGEGMKLIKSSDEFRSIISNLLGSQYIFEKYYNYNREYRLHVTKDGCFYTCRKMLRNDVPEEERWYRNDNNCVWIKEDNESFDKPGNWNRIEEDCVKALGAIGLDFAAFDVKVQSSRGGERTNPKYVILESNSAPSFGEVTKEKYIGVLNKLISQKIDEEKFINL